MIILTSCTARKLDGIPIPQRALTIQPSDYLKDQNLLKKLKQTRQQIFADPRANVGIKSTCAFDLYTNTGNAYKELKKNHYEKIKSLLVSRKLDWYFLSGGYGLIHALEPAKKYQATFNRSISYMKKIPFTANLWSKTLPDVIEHIISKAKPERFYAFGSQDYTRFVKVTNLWKSLDNDRIGYKIFESTGSAGAHWISKILDELASCITNNDLNLFDQKYPQFLKQKKNSPKTQKKRNLLDDFG